MKKYGIGLMALLLIGTVCMTSCGKKPHITVSKRLLTYSYAGGSDCFLIEADCDWFIDNNPTNTWLSCYPSSGRGNDTVLVNVQKNKTLMDRSAIIRVISKDGKKTVLLQIAQEKINQDELYKKVWFTRTYERWNTDYFNDSIVDSYRYWTFYSNEGSLNWFFYFFEDGTGYEIRTENYDTIYYPFQHQFYPEKDSLDIIFQLEDTLQREDYHATVMELNNERFTIRNEYRPHQFEKINLVNVTGNNSMTKPSKNSKKIGKKAAGPLIEVD